MQFVQKSYMSGGREVFYTSVEFTPGSTDQEMLAELAEWLSHCDGTEDQFDMVRDLAADIANDAEILFVYEDVDGNRQEYTPASMWEPSGGCEWETSAQYGYDYGWNI
ncbi:hypothetical protein [Pseudomonas helleri]|uniref:hypothetical protein n=1 Tax=Pseudomonas helleri TaxID=1608996 RepID=UPI00242BF7B1|nr:hypothetical protein [Pseudomonas helleri]